MNGSYSRMACPKGGQCTLIPYRQMVTKFILHLRLSLTLLAYVGIICAINSLEQGAVTDRGPAVTVQCCLHWLPLFGIPRLAQCGGGGCALWMPPGTSRITSGSCSRQLHCWTAETNKHGAFCSLGFFPSTEAVLKSRQHFFLNIYLFIYGERKFKDSLLSGIADT